MNKYNLSGIFSDLNSESSVILPKSIKIKSIKNLDTISDATSSFIPQKGGYSDATSSFMPQKGGYSDATSSFMPQKGGYSDATSSFMPQKRGHLGSSNNDINQLLSMLSVTSNDNLTTNSTDTEQLRNKLLNILDGGSPKRSSPGSSPTRPQRWRPQRWHRHSQSPDKSKLPNSSDSSSSSSPIPDKSKPPNSSESSYSGSPIPDRPLVIKYKPLMTIPPDKNTDKLKLLKYNLDILKDNFTGIFNIVLEATSPDPRITIIAETLREYTIKHPRGTNFEKIKQDLSLLLPDYDKVIDKVIDIGIILTSISHDVTVTSSLVRHTLEKMGEGYNEQQKKELVHKMYAKIYNKSISHPKFIQDLDSIIALINELDITNKNEFLMYIYDECFETLHKSFINLFFYYMIIMKILEQILEQKLDKINITIILILILDRMHTLYSRMPITYRIIFSELYNSITKQITTNLYISDLLKPFEKIIFQFAIFKTKNFTNSLNIIIKDSRTTVNTKKKKIDTNYTLTINNPEFIEVNEEYLKLDEENQEKLIQHIRYYCFKILDVNLDTILSYSFIELLFYYNILLNIFTKTTKHVRTLVFIFECIINIYFNMSSNKVTIFNNLYNIIDLYFKNLNVEKLIPMKKIMIKLVNYKIHFFTDFSNIRNEEDITKFYERINREISREISIDLFKSLTKDEQIGYLKYIYVLCEMTHVPLINLLLHYVITRNIAIATNYKDEKIINEIIKIHKSIERKMTSPYLPKKEIFESLFKQISDEIITIQNKSVLKFPSIIATLERDAALVRLDKKETILSVIGDIGDISYISD